METFDRQQMQGYLCHIICRFLSHINCKTCSMNLLSFSNEWSEKHEQVKKSGMVLKPK